MTVNGEPARQLPAEGDGDGTPRPARRRGSAAVLEICPYLAVETGSWRSAYAAREHRCQAVQPAARLAISKQRQLCLLPAHATCATYLAAMAVAAGSVPAAPGDDGAALWPVTASTPLVLEPARRMGALPVASARGGGQALLIGLMVVAFLVLVIARTQSPGGGGAPVPGTSAVGGVAASSVSPSEPASPTASPPASASASVAASPSAAPDPSPSPAVAPTAGPTATPKPTAEPSTATRSYRVRSGDTLSSIAARYRTTVAVLAALNGISDPRLIRVGQVLRIP